MKTSQKHNLTTHFLLQGIFLLLALAAPPHTHAQTWQWAQSAGSYGSDYGISLATDASGNIYTTGTYGAEITFGSITLTGKTLFAVKYDSLGNVLWAKDAGTNMYDLPRSVSVDAAGNACVSGIFEDSIVFGAYTLRDSSIGFNFYVVKYNTDGDVLWAKSAGDSNDVRCFNAAIDTLGNTYVVGTFASKATFGTTTLFASQGNSFVVKYDPLGDIVWAKNITDTDGAAAGPMAADKTGNFYLMGYIGHDSIKFGATTLYKSAGSVFVAKFDSAGNAIWATNTGSGFPFLYSIGNDVFGNVYIAGYFSHPTFTIGATTITGPGMFLIKFDSSGHMAWYRNADSAMVNSLSTDALGNIYITGRCISNSVTFGAYTILSSDANLFVVKYDPSGNVIWATASGGSSAAAGESIVNCGSGGVYITGYFYSDTLVLGDNLLMNAVFSSPGFPPTNDMFIAKLDTTTVAAGLHTVSRHQRTITLYPNPNNGRMIISLPATGCTSLQVMDCLGIVVYSTALTGYEIKAELNIDNLLSGVYYLHAICGDKNQNVPFVIKR